jgi:signal transduction histidine kinase/CheY-like chemotaxis protein
VTLQTATASAVLKRAGKTSAILQIFSGVLVAVLILLYLDMSSRQAGLVDGICENAMWSVYQLDREARMLDYELDHTLHADDASRGGLKTMATRYDILYSRVDLLKKTKFQDYFTGNARVGALLDQISTSVIRLAPLFDRIEAKKPVTRAELLGLTPIIDRIGNQTSEFLIYTNNAASVNRADNRQDILKLEHISAIMTGLLLTSVIFLIVILRRQLTALKEAGLGLETITHEMTTAYEAADAGNRAKSQFMATMGHEIRTPLNAILGMAELLQHSELADADRENVRVIRSSGEALLEVLNEVLDFSKIEHGSLELEIRPVDVRKLAEDAVSIIRGRAQEKGYDITLDIAEHLTAPIIATDPTRLRQVILNLMSNAVKFTDHGGVVLRIREYGREPSLRLFVEVEDSGIGIEDAGMARLFKPFSQVDASISRKYGGTGLGLTICKQIVEQLGGSIGVHSKRRSGSVFYFEFPVEAVAASPHVSGSEERKELSALLRKKILLVEDNRVNQQVATRFLNRLGQDVVIAENGSEAVRITADQDFDLILMDMQMPVMDGIEATRRIIARGGRQAETPIVAMTANASDQDRMLCMDAGMRGFEPKPITMNRLHALLAGNMPLSGTPDDAVKDRHDTATTVDTDRRMELIDALGEDVFEELLETFFNDADALLKDLRACLAKGDAAAIDAVLHTMKGAAANVGFGAIARFADGLRRKAVGADNATALEIMINSSREKLAA